MTIADIRTLQSAARNGWLIASGKSNDLVGYWIKACEAHGKPPLWTRHLGSNRVRVYVGWELKLDGTPSEAAQLIRSIVPPRTIDDVIREVMREVMPCPTT